MSVEAIIDDHSIEFSQVGDVVGECQGVVTGFDRAGSVVSVNPAVGVCNSCPLSEHCTESKASH